MVGTKRKLDRNASTNKSSKCFNQHESLDGKNYDDNDDDYDEINEQLNPIC